MIQFIILKQLKPKKKLIILKRPISSDGSALTKYLFWIKKCFLKKKITEISASQKLLNLEKKIKIIYLQVFQQFLEQGPNGAIIHYKATKKTNRQLKKGDIYLVDSGGHYKYGTTDVTRTISLKNSEKRNKEYFYKSSQRSHNGFKFYFKTKYLRLNN